MMTGTNISLPGRRDSGSAIRGLGAMTHPRSDRHKQLVRGAQQLVSQTFYGQMLKQMRDDPFKSDLFDGGRGGQMFSALLDQRLADRMARGVGDKLVNSIVRHIEGRTSKQPPGHAASLQRTMAPMLMADRREP